MISYKIFILLLMLLMHYIEDFHLQGCLANLKQKEWWKKQINENPKIHTVFEYSIYKNDYKMSLFAHSIENALFVMLPLMIDLLISELVTDYLRNTWIFFVPAIALICVSHYVIDNLKANEMKINLIKDQILHIIFILIVFLFAFCGIGVWIV